MAAAAIMLSSRRAGLTPPPPSGPDPFGDAVLLALLLALAIGIAWEVRSWM